MFTRVKNAFGRMRAHWRVPAPGYFVPHKETAGLSVGKFGWALTTTLFAKIALTGSNIIVAQALHVDPIHITSMNVIATAAGFWFTLIRSHWVDNSQSPEGRFRPFMKMYGIPTLIFASAVVWFPFHLLPNGGEAIAAGNWGTGYWMKVGILMFLILGLQFFYPIYSMGYNNLVMVISPNSQERLNIEVVTNLVAGNAWTWADVFYMMVSGQFANRLADIRLYRYCYIPVCILGLAISYVGYYTTKERILQSRAHVNQMSLRETFRAVSKNKNFWVICASQWAGFLENNSEDLLMWTYVYQRKLTEAQYTTADMAWRAGAAFAPYLAPFAAKRFGKRTILIFCNMANILLLAATYKTFHIVPVLVAFRFINFFFNSLQGNIQPALNADIRDAQQYISGERIDGMFNMVSYMGSFIGMLTSFVTPFLWRRGGIYEGNGAVDFNGNKGMWYALRDEGVFNNVSRMMIVTSVIGSIMNVIPMFFYDLTETRQRGMSKALRLRAMFEDYASGILKPETRDECEKIVSEAREGIGDAEENEFVIKELSKYDTPEMTRRLTLARGIVDGGYKGILEFDPEKLKHSKDKEEKIVLLEMKEAQKIMRHLYPDGNLTEPDYRALAALYETRPKSRSEAKELRLKIKALEQERRVYHRCTKPYVRAKRLLANCENASRLDEIFAKDLTAGEQAPAG